MRGSLFSSPPVDWAAEGSRRAPGWNPGEGDLPDPGAAPGPVLRGGIGGGGVQDCTCGVSGPAGTAPPADGLPRAEGADQQP